MHHMMVPVPVKIKKTKSQTHSCATAVPLQLMLNMLCFATEMHLLYAFRYLDVKNLECLFLCGKHVRAFII